MKANMGDKVTIEGVVVGVDNRSGGTVLVGTGSCTCWVDSDSIKRVEPSPLKVGDEVVYVGTTIAPMRPYKIKSIYEAWAWIARTDADVEPWTTPLSNLQRAL